MDEAKISVVVHFLNSARYLEEAVESILWQTFSDWELVLVDGGSTDASAEIAREFARRFPERMRVYRHSGPKTLGIFSSRIWGAKEARAPILAHLDSDDEWHPRFLERQYAIYSTFFHSSPGIVYSPMVYWWEEPQRAFESYVQPIPAPGLYKPPSLVVDMISDDYAKSPGNSSVMIAREIVIQAAELIGIAEEKIADDQFLWSFVTLRFPVVVHPEPLSRYRQWPGSVCAQAIGAGDHHIARERHLNWLARHITNCYFGIKKQELLHAVYLQLDRSMQDS
jgi:glycosyltransferase involved in cell wall biosynthesis